MPHAIVPPTAKAVGKATSRQVIFDPDARQDLLVMALGLIVLCAWDLSGWDMVLTRWFGTPKGFPWVDHWFVSGVLHKALRYPMWLLFAVLLVSVWKPMAWARGLSRGQRIWWVATTACCVLLISFLKRESATSCPWELAEFGGSVAQHVPHWLLFFRDGGPGHCFPSGHASTAFAFFSGYFALRKTAPRIAYIWLAIVLLLGCVFAWAQLMRGAHHLSHSLWTAWICWAATAISFQAMGWLPIDWVHRRKKQRGLAC